MTKQDNAIYASRSGIVLLAGNQTAQAKDAATVSATAADKALQSSLTFVSAVRERLEACIRNASTDDTSAVY